MFETKAGVLFIAGLGFFLFAFLSNATLPMIMYGDLPELSVEELVDVNASNPDDPAEARRRRISARRIIGQFDELCRTYPESAEEYYGVPELPDTAGYGTPEFEAAVKEREEVLRERVVDALRLGRQVYIGEGCWHCHSQFVRPVSNEDKRWGSVSESWEYQNELQRPVMFGTRRVGPDLSREGGRRGNDWHATHFYNPQLVVDWSPMPAYTWFFDGSPDKPNKRGLAIITYIQWLGSWLPEYPYYEQTKAYD